MTAEIAILNANAIALAADSAATTMIGQTAKVYHSSEKLFQLVENASVGIMVNGASQFLGISWETIIKTYRKKRQGKTFRDLKSYKDDFLDFVSSHESMFPEELQLSYIERIIKRYFMSILEQARKIIDKDSKSEEGVDEDSLQQMIQNLIEGKLQKIEERPRLSGFDDKFIEDIRNLVYPLIEQTRQELCAEIPLNTETIGKLETVTFEVLTRVYMIGFESELVFAGYGDNEYMPRLYSVEVELMIKNRIRSVDVNSTELNSDEAYIIPFAQHDMVQSFLDGVHPELEKYMSNTISRVLGSLIEQLSNIMEHVDNFSVDGLKNELTQQIPSLIDTLQNSWKTAKREQWRPIIANVALLPKDELGALAEALVNLTKFKRRIGLEEETVGGPIDVAVITKADGFVWIKRKHYFEPELNPRIIAQYGGTK